MKSQSTAVVLGLLLVGTALGLGQASTPFTLLDGWVWWTEGGNPVMVAELQINILLHETYVYIVWAYSDGTTITDIWYFEQTLRPGGSIPLYAPRRHLNPWAQVVGLWTWYYNYSPGAGRCTYDKLTSQSSQWISGDGGPRVSGVVLNSGGISTAYVVFAALYDSNGDILDVNWSSDGVKANSTDGFTVGFHRVDRMPGVPSKVANHRTWVFQGQFGWQWVGTIFPNEPLPRTWPGLRNVCPSE